MNLARKIDKALVFLIVVSLIITMAIVFGIVSRETFAEKKDDPVEIIEGAKFVTFYDGEEKLTVKTEARTVGEALGRAGIIMNSGDRVEPELETEINANNYYVNIYRARPVIIMDGDVSKYLMTASYDVKDIADEANITVYDGDEVVAEPNTKFLEVGTMNVYRIIRNGGRTLTVEEEIPFDEKTERDANLASGELEVRQLGEVGVKRVTYNVQYVDNTEVSRELVSEEIVKEPLERIVAVGIKKSILPEWGECEEWVRQAGISEADVAAALDIIYRESGCRVDATNPSGAYGIPQALPGSKMASAGADWETNPITQIKWMSSYVTGRYGGWKQALEYWYSHGWY